MKKWFRSESKVMNKSTNKNNHCQGMDAAVGSAPCRRCGALAYEKDNLYSMMRACGHHLYIRSGRSAGQGRILAILLERSSMTQKELQDILGIQPGSISEILAKMEEKSLIRRQRDDEDRRRSVIELTVTGREEAELQERQDDGSPTFGVLSQQEQEELKAMLWKLLESWK